MHKLLSLPESLVPVFHDLTGHDREVWFVSCDPQGKKIGSGGGTASLLSEHWQFSGKTGSFDDYLASGKKIILHAGGHSRRLPSYAPSGKVLAPVPVFRWSQGQRLDQTLLDLQMPLLEKIMEASRPDQHVMIAAGDVLIQSPEVFYDIPQADVVCFGMWADPHLASHHGVFFTSRTDPDQLDFMLQKPGHSEIERLSSSHLYLMDIGIWILSDRAVDLLMKRCGWNGKKFRDDTPCYYDIYSTFGPCLGLKPEQSDPDLCRLTASVVPLHSGSFYHYGTSSEMISSTEKIQNRVQDQRSIWHNRVKAHPSLFVQNALADINWERHQHHVWIENSHIPSSWILNSNHVITGIPGNDWEISLSAGLCLDMVPIGEDKYCVRPYGIEDNFRGRVGDKETLWMGIPFVYWLKARDITFRECGINEDEDIQSAALFPVAGSVQVAEAVLKWIIEGNNEGDQKSVWLKCERLSADELCSRANLKRLFLQRQRFSHQNLRKLSLNYKHSVFYQADLKHAAVQFTEGKIALPALLPDTEPALLRCRDHMFRSELLRLNGKDGAKEENMAFRALQQAITNSAPRTSIPRINIFADQIIWGRSPARLDLAGGWSDTPPYCLQNGGSVLNMAVELNGQPPIQVFIRLSEEKNIVLRSIDNGVSEVVSTFEELAGFIKVGSAFSIPKAALYLAGFHPDFCGTKYKSLEEQLTDFGGGFEISLLAAIPKGSGLGTSSILAATILGTLSEFCSLNWDNRVICHRTLILEQLLTTGGGWQDQYGGILPGIKLLESEPGIQEKISVRWMPDLLFTRPEYKDCWLLYYTGVTRIAKNILAEIVRGMFLNEGARLRIVDEIRQHAYQLAEAMQRSDYLLTAKMVARSWDLNNALDSGTNTPEIQTIIDRIRNHTIGFKLLGAGGGGYMLIAASDHAAALKIQEVLNLDPPNAKARFVKMEVSDKGFMVSRS
ncbi:MAG TPA: bifunctional fucokinase/fucose-1-phosphate guanylyltransferase [Bacteroidales bacterium]|nr:bifunctional fucokinase/fucose-1-phosphate guanylyltransferase [Bacteroidales bacterium]